MKNIMFNDKYYLTQSTLDGYKTNTRRIEPCCKFIPDAVSTGYKRAEFVGDTLKLWKDESKTFIEFKTRYQVGEVVAIAQRYEDAINKLDWVSIKIHENTPGWNNKMFVRADLMPHRIKITGIKLERLQDISEEDCFKEGISCFLNHGYQNGMSETNRKISYGFHGLKDFFESPIEAYSLLIDRISGKGTWQSNPYVFAYSFELIK